MAVTAKLYVLPDPAFGPGSKGYQMRSRTRNRIQDDETLGIDALRINDQVNDNRHGMVGDDDGSDDDGNTEGTSTATRTYVGAGSYF